MFSQTVDYAVRAMIFLASCQPGEVMSAGRIAEAVRVPPRYLSKVMRGLVVAELVGSARGPNGGFALRGDPKGITMHDIVDAVGSGHARGNRTNDGRTPGRLADTSWRGGVESLERALYTTTLSDLLRAQQGDRKT